GDFIKTLSPDSPDSYRDRDDKKEQNAGQSKNMLRDFQTLNEYDPTIVAERINRRQAAIEAVRQNIRAKSGPDMFDFILEDIQELKKSMRDPQSFGVFMTAMNAASWINQKMKEWLGEKNVADTLAQSAPNNVTSEMGLELLDVADVIRPYPEVIQYLQNVKDDNFLDELVKF